MTSDTPVVVGDRISVVPEELVAGGAGLARINGFPIFVKAIYPGDRALVEVVEVKKGYARAALVDLLQPGPLRKAAPCPVAEACGGCDWTALRLDHQLVAKRRILAESLRRVGKLDRIPEIRTHPSPLNYRLRSRLHNDGGGPGFFAEQSNSVVPLPPECEVIGPRLLGALFPEGSRDADAAAVERAFSSAADDRVSVEVFENDFDLAAADADGEPQSARIDVRGLTFELSTDAFFQVNRHLLGRLLDLVTALASGTAKRRTALDLYSGVGFFTLPLAGLFDRVIAVEGSAVGHFWGRRNARPYPNVQVQRDDVQRFLARRRDSVDLVFVDPPRAGMAAGVSERVADLAEERICYLSCDPVTFSRDAARLARRGWSLRTLDLVDLFPNTHHIETLSSFERAS